MASKNNISGNSFYVTLTIAIFLAVIGAISIHSYILYEERKSVLSAEIKDTSTTTLHSMKKTILSFIESYAINAYEQYITNELEKKHLIAIVVEDYNMGKILGKQAYVTGKIKTNTNEIQEYDSTNKEHKRLLQKSYFTKTTQIQDAQGNILGLLSIYSSGEFIEQEKKEIIQKTFYQSLGLSLVLILSLIATIRNFVLQPISNIIKTIAHTNSSGIPINKIEVSGSYEVSLLANTINTMVDTIIDSQDELEAQRNELIEQKHILHHQATHDALTGLANRLLFHEQLENAIHKAYRVDTKVAILFIDLDHFKEINDSMGHNVGDEVLKQVTKRLQKVIRKTDTLARLGGDEFTLLIEDLMNPEEISRLANTILKIIEKPFEVDENKFFISSSIGISIYPDDGTQIIDLIKYADTAMYKAKNQGRNNFQYYSSEMTAIAFERVIMEANIRSAIQNEEFLIYYQPQIDGRNNKLVGMEALVRWKHINMGLVSPGKFIPIAESTGLIIDIDRYVIQHTMKQVAKWHQLNYNPGIVSINISIKQLQHASFIEVLERLLHDTKCKPEWIELEITESHIMKDPEEAIRILNRINSLGIKLAVDDFGTGYSSLSYLKRLPIKKLKIDQSFVKDLPDDEDDAAISKAVIALAKSLNLEIIAEGVENQKQQDFLIKNGCNNIQGFLYSEPISAQELEEKYLKLNR